LTKEFKDSDWKEACISRWQWIKTLLKMNPGTKPFEVVQANFDNYDKIVGD
jgi:hypothetical protein